MRKHLQIGPLALDGCAVLAPMAGVTNSPLRRIAKRKGAALVFTEMISADGLLRGQGKARIHFFKLLYVHPEERPVAFQIFGADPEPMARAAAMLAELDADLIDLNMGCPVKKVTKKGAGVALMKDPERAGKMIRAVRKVIGKVPLTVKMRTGLTDHDNQALELCRIAEAEGADGVIIHGRSKEQLFSGPPDYAAIRECVAAVKIPVLGNGGIKSASDAEKMIAETGCAGVMIARGALGNPWLFARLRDPDAALPSVAERAQTVLLHLDLSVKHFGEEKAVVEMRKHLGWYAKGLTAAVELRKSLNKMVRRNQAAELIEKYFKDEA